MKTLTLSQTSLDQQLLYQGDREADIDQIVMLQGVRKVLHGMIM